MLLLARKTRLISAIDSEVHVLKRHLPYHESDHVLNLAFNILAGGKRIEHIELRRNDEVYLDALGAQRVPDPTITGDLCRRFRESDIMDLTDAFNQTRKGVWAEQSPEFFDLAILDADGTLVETDAECEQGIDIAYDGTWGYHALLISLANTAEPLFLVSAAATAPRRSRPTSTWTKPSNTAALPASAESCCGATTSSRRPGIWTVGTFGWCPLRLRIEAHESLKALADDLTAARVGVEDVE